MFRPRFRVAVAALVFDEQGRVLLFKHTYRKLAWGIPVGALEYGESPEKGVIREFHEETGMTISVERLMLAESSPRDRHITLVYLCRIVDGEFKESYEVSEIQYFHVNDLPPILAEEKDLIQKVYKNLYHHELA